jgi:hypothetical protein
LFEAYSRIIDRDGDEWGYIRGVILKALSKLPSFTKNTVEFLQEAAFDGKTNLERTMASESLLLLQGTDALQEDTLSEKTGQVTDNYLAKNFIFLHAAITADGNEFTSNLSQPRILNEAIEFTRSVPKLDQIYRHEPDILREKFYESDYPDDSEEFEDFPYRSQKNRIC